MSTTYKCITIAYLKFHTKSRTRGRCDCDATRRDSRSAVPSRVHLTLINTTISLTLGHSCRMLDKEATISQTEIKVLTICIGRLIQSVREWVVSWSRYVCMYVLCFRYHQNTSLVSSVTSVQFTTRQIYDGGTSHSHSLSDSVQLLCRYSSTLGSPLES